MAAPAALPPHGTTWLVGGWAYSVTILAILGCHEFGHYFACRYYDVDASLPYFLPLPITLTGTLGAFIRIREPIPSKRMLFDIGIAGPIAGFLVAVPALFFGVALSTVAPIGPEDGLWLGEPLLVKLASRVLWGSLPDSQTLLLHPVGFAAWFGLLATALNLFPIGQLDGGHISYAVLGRRSTYVTVTTIGVAIALAFRSASWIVWTVLMIAHARHLRPAPSPHDRRGRPAGSHAADSGGGRRDHLRPVLHARPDRAAHWPLRILEFRFQTAKILIGRLPISICNLQSKFHLNL